MTPETFSENTQLQAMAALLAQASTPIVVCQQRQVLAVSQGWLTLTDLGLSSPCALADWESRCQIDDQALQRLLTPQAPTPTEVRQTLTLTDGQGQIRHCSVHLNRFNSPDLADICWLIFTDNTEQHRMEQALGQVIATASSARGRAFFDRLTRTLCTTLNLDGALIAEVDSSAEPMLQGLSGYIQGSYKRDICYSLVGTPCERVLSSRRPIHYASTVSQRFPADQFLREQQIESYLGFPLCDSDGRPMGVIALMSCQPMEMSSTLISMLQFVASRVESDLQRQQAEKQLEVSQLGLHAAERLANMGSWVVDATHQSVVISEQMSTIYHLDEFNCEVPRSLTLQRIHPDDRVRVQAQIAAGETSGKPYNFHHRILLPDGEVRWIRSGCEPVMADGRVSKIFGVSQDITELTHSQRQAFESEQMQRRLISACPYGITYLDRDLNFVYINHVAEKIYGYQQGELQGRSLAVVLPDDQWQQTCTLFNGLLDKSPRVTQYHRVGKRPDGTFRELDVTLNYMLDEEGNTQGFIGFLTDVTDKIATELRLTQLSIIVEQSPSSILITDVAGKIEYVNPAFETTSGYKLRDLVGETPRVLRSGKTPPAVYEGMWQTITSGQPWRGELLNRRKDGSMFWELASLAPIRSPDGEVTHFVSINEDITRLKDQEAQLAWQASYDPVTHLPNRVLAMDRLSCAINVARQNNSFAAVMFVDLDQFKRINDTFGHSSGDKLLVRAAERLKQVVTAGDTVARFGGDEFVVLLDDQQDLISIEKVAEKVLRAFNVPVLVGEHQLTVTASVGVAVYPQDGDDPETLLSHADAAMYSAKDQGRNGYYFFTPQMNEQARLRLKLESQLQQALVRQQMTVVYQPVISFSTGEMVGAEALMRWYSPELGHVPPDQFIPLAEDLGLIDELGEWVIDQVLSQYREWRNLVKPEFRCAINVSPRQFQRGELASFLLSRLDYYNVPGSAIELEVTEGLLMQNWPTIDRQIHDLAAAGISLSIDDFGTGYSSISYLRKYPFNTLKIDRSFVRELLEDKEDETLVRSVIAMAHSMGLSIIAEGVETAAQYHMLRDARCCMMQGYLFSRPIPASDFEHLLENPRDIAELLLPEAVLD